MRAVQLFGREPLASTVTVPAKLRHSEEPADRLQGVLFAVLVKRKMLWGLLAALGAMSMIDWAVVFLCIGALLYWTGTWSFSHFSARGMPFEKPVPFFGNMLRVVTFRQQFSDFLLEVYRRHEGQRAFGLFQFTKPTLVIRDPEIIKQVAVKEFDSFVNHLPITSEKADELFSRNLFSLKDQEWRDMRATLSPAFTSSKMRNIFTLIELCGKQMVEFVNDKMKASPAGVYETEMKDFFTRFANDVIATTAFGIECDSLRQQNNEFYKMGRDLTNFKGFRGLLFFAHRIFPRVMEVLNMPIITPKARSFFDDIVHNTIDKRIKKGIFRPDMLQLLIQARQGELKAEMTDEQENVKGGRILRLDNGGVSAQAMIFFFAGFDTVSTALSFCAWALARHTEEQERARQEVDEVMGNHEGNLTYEAVNELKYLDAFVSEVLRLYATNPFLDRMCNAEFTIPADGDVPAYTVKKGEVIWFPVIGLHKDPQYWPNPDKFDPERFSDENKHNIKPFTYMPFGVGPRICIGSRLALMETKVALAHMLHNFNIVSTKKTPPKLEYDKKDLLISLKNGFWVGFEERKNK